MYAARTWLVVNFWSLVAFLAVLERLLAKPRIRLALIFALINIIPPPPPPPLLPSPPVARSIWGRGSHILPYTL